MSVALNLRRALPTSDARAAQEALRYLKEHVPPGAREARMYNMAVASALREGLPAQAEQLIADMAAAGVARDGESWHLAMRLQVRSTPPMPYPYSLHAYLRELSQGCGTWPCVCVREGQRGSGILTSVRS